MLSNLINISLSEVKHIIFKYNNLNLGWAYPSFNKEEDLKIREWADKETTEYFIKQLKKFDESKTIEEYEKIYDQECKYRMALDLLYYCI